MTDNEIKLKLSQVVARLMFLIPDAHREEAAEGLYIAGGAIVSLVLGETPHDYDVFLRDEKVRDIFISAAKTGLNVIANTQNAITYKLDSGEVVQVVTRFLGPPERVFDSFDFEFLKCFYVPMRWYGAVQETVPDTLIMDRALIEAKKLTYTGRKDVFTLNTLKRLCKFVSRGFTPDNESIMNLHTAIQNRPHLQKDPKEKAAQGIGFYGSSFN